MIKYIVDLDQYSSIVCEILSKKPKVIVLNGPLGSGKTTFVKYIAKEMGITKVVSSPTFNIIKEYDQKLCHIDAYRVYDEDIGLDYYFESGYLICIEWSENILDYLPFVDVVIDISYFEKKRKILVSYNEKT